VRFELTPVTEAGRRFVKITEDLADVLRAGAPGHDRAGTFPFENFAALRQSGALAACIPEELGGMGMESLHDLAVGINRLGRADGATAIACHMHVAAGWQFTRAWRDAAARGDELADILEGFLRWLGSGEAVLCVGGTEAGTATGFPLAEVTRADGGDGWVLNGRKIFASNSPTADVFAVYVRIPNPDGDHIGLAFVLPGTPGFEIRQTWDGLGMRASGSNDLVFEDSPIPDAMLFDVGPWGVLDEFWLTFFSAGNIGLLGAFIGIAEEARDAVVRMLATRRKSPGNRLVAERYGIQHGVAEIEVALTAARATLSTTCLALDDYLGSHLASEAELVELRQLMKLFVCTKQFVNEQAISAVDRAMTVSGGAGYFGGSLLARLYRDVRAGPFMQPYSPNEAFEYIGKVALGLEPVVDL
jgi:alkylation response protein AidB-like acyl-CoA dehydrogenase